MVKLPQIERFFLFSFSTKIYFRVRNLHEYTPAAPLPDGRDLSAKQINKILRRDPWSTRLPAGRPPAHLRTHTYPLADHLIWYAAKARPAHVYLHDVHFADHLWPVRHLP